MQQIGLAALLIGMAIFLTCYAIWAPKGRASLHIRTIDEAEDNGFNRYVRPMLRNFIPQTPLDAAMNGDRQKKIQELLIRSGNPWKIRPEEFLGIQVLFMAIGFFLGLALLGLGVLDMVPYVPPFVIIFFMTGAGYLIPYSIHNTLREERAREVQKQLPEGLDLLVITLASGQNFEPALAQVVPTLPEGLLREELTRVNQQLAAGRTIKDALESFARRATSDEVESFAKAVIQAQKLGADVSETLVNQASSARAAYENRLEKKIAKLSSTMMIPLIFTMIPALMIIVLGPALSSLGGTF